MQAALALLMLTLAGYEEPAVQPTAFEDGHSRPRALAVSSDGLLFVALSTANQVAVLSPGPTATERARVEVCRFPESLAALPGGRVLVSCRFDPDLRLISPRGDTFDVEHISAGPEHGHRGLAADAAGHFAYVASPALGGVKVIDLTQRKVIATVTTGLSPRAVGLIDGKLLVSNFIGHTVTVHAVGADGIPGAALQTIRTEAGVKDFALVGQQLWLLTHEDRSIDRSHTSVEGLDSAVLMLERGPAGFVDPGPGRRQAMNLTEREGEPVVKLDAIAVEPRSGRVAIAGSGSDNVWERAGKDVRVFAVGSAPAALAWLPDGRLAVADRLSDTVRIVGGKTSEVVVGKAERKSPAELGELLFYGRSLVPNNVATGGLSIYACSACHEDGHVDGRLHPAKKNRFFSMTKTCRGVATTPPYLSLGNLKTLPIFSDNIVASHAQGAEADPKHFDQYPVTLATRAAQVTLSPDEVRDALTAYLATIPPEPSPFVPVGATALSTEARRGESLFLSKCTRCHEAVGNTALGNKPPRPEVEQRLLHQQLALAGKKLYDVGTPVLGEGGNNPPPLRGVWDAAPYFSDGSAATLESALERTDPGKKKVHAPLVPGERPRLSEADRADLAAFLRSL
jgi:DNA-binding beta-propeller fold protein YncE/mono/diheme cytochrome c family protein